MSEGKKFHRTFIGVVGVGMLVLCCMGHLLKFIPKSSKGDFGDIGDCRSSPQ